MPSDKPKILFVLDEELLEKIDDYRYLNRIPSRAEAIRRLVEEGLKHQQHPPKVSHKKPAK